jgi:hypothetical protein
MPDKNERYAKFQAMGPDKVRESLELGLFNETNARYARAWLRGEESVALSRLRSHETTMNTVKLVTAIIAAVASTAVATVTVMTYLD